ncbi:MAG: STAS domain-containing protein [Planctomycetota bacterium]|jgi:anti-anti-sigma factor
MPDPIVPRFELDGGTLRITGDLHAAAEHDLRDATDRLLGSDASPLVIDITHVQYRGSSYVRLIAMAMIRANERGMTLTVRATERTARILEMGGLEKLGRIETVPDA